MNNLFELFYTSTVIATDTRNIEKDSLFICLKGDNFNGNEYAHAALEKGASYCVVDEVIGTEDSRLLKVDDVLIALQALAKKHRTQFNIPFIAIAGETEMENNQFMLKNLETGEQKSYALDELISFLKN